jgi:hypothetical protein
MRGRQDFCISTVEICDEFREKKWSILEGKNCIFGIVEVVDASQFCRSFF